METIKEVISGIYGFIAVWPNLSMFIVFAVAALIQKYMPASVPFFGEARKTINQFSQLTHFHIPQNSTEIKRKAIQEGLTLAAKALDIEIAKDQKKKHPNNK